MIRRGEATAYGAVTVVNALATGKGAAFGVDLWTKATVEPSSDESIETIILHEESENTKLAEICVRKILDQFGEKTRGAKVQTESNIPIARGLKSSSVAANAVTLATLSALDKQLDPNELLRIIVEASLEAEVSVTGAFDDAAASLYGNVVVTDNIARKLLRIFPVDEHCVLLLVPHEKRYTINADISRIKAIAEQVAVAHKEALKGAYWNAMTLNGLLYAGALRLETEVIIESLECGAVAAGISGKGPAYAFVVKEESKNSVLEILKEHEGQILTTHTRRRPSLTASSLDFGGFSSHGDDDPSQ
jgi:shikimate kinase